MYEKDGEKYFVVDSHVHWWDASPENQLNEYGRGWIDCFYGYHASFTPEEDLWTIEQFEKYSEETMMKDLFEEGYVDKAIFLPTYLTDFYKNGFNTTERNAILAEKHPDKFIVNGAWDPRDGTAGLEALEEKNEKYDLKGVKLYTAEWRGDSKGFRLDDEACKPYYEKCLELGITNIHVHKGPTIWPLNRDSFDVHDVDDVATSYPDLTFIIEHVGLPRLEDFCWIAVQESNVWGGLAVAMAFVQRRPRYFAKVLAELLTWVGEDKLTFASDYAIWKPKWLVEAFVDFQIPEDMQDEYMEGAIFGGPVDGLITPNQKRKILGLNAAKLYDIEVPEEVAAQAAAAEGAEEPVPA